MYVCFFFFISHIWCDGHSTSINSDGVEGLKVRNQVFRKQLHIYILLNSTRVAKSFIDKLAHHHAQSAWELAAYCNYLLKKFDKSKIFISDNKKMYVCCNYLHTKNIR